MKKDRQDADLKENKKQSMRGIEDRAIEIGKKARNEVSHDDCGEGGVYSRITSS